ncbi:lysozyme inhibitor LprI family protein [Pseudochrobactrum asaccharolyticum]|uniref:Uncharacterized protein YecT (DUF1311 family) n=1 Tax=Pseudochrobactrum asaccharolyticum TaxID=354351 RepID=A0A366DI40_9HYPH|nr:lysozyme inhibitor LprI family protein [Pseudochrobactrum asaccharolyticum]RBO89691.1 uncharacterized protein YecT (DUF1311 family) [Pseudochrobactrum asaccharolyticum]
MKLFTLMALGAVVFALPSYASIDCDKAEDQATMTKCANDELAKADKQLNANYKKIESRLADDEDTKKLLITSQRLWMKFRDAECNFATSTIAGGSLHPMMVAMCRSQLTSDRNKQLSNYLNCEEGDLTCPVPSGE